MYRVERINSEFRKVIAEAVRNLRDPRLTEMVTVTAVKADADLRGGRVYVSVFCEDADKKKEHLNAVRDGAGFIRGRLARAFPSMRRIPVLQYFSDESADYGARIDELLGRIKKDGGGI